MTVRPCSACQNKSISLAYSNCLEKVWTTKKNEMRFWQIGFQPFGGQFKIQLKEKPGS